MRGAGHALLVGIVLGLAAPAMAQYKPPTYLAEPGSLTDRYLTAGEARDVLHTATATLESCFLEHTGISNTPGDVNLTLIVGGDGQPTEVKLEIEDGWEPLRGCLLGAAEALVFPAHDGDPLNLAYPLVFVRDDRGSRLVPYPIVFVKPRERAFLLLRLPLTLTPEERDELQRLLYP